MRVCLMMCTILVASAGDTLLGPGTYSSGVSAAPVYNFNLKPASAGVYATKCRHCSGVLIDGSFVPDLELKRGR